MSPSVPQTTSADAQKLSKRKQKIDEDTPFPNHKRPADSKNKSTDELVSSTIPLNASGRGTKPATTGSPPGSPPPLAPLPSPPVPVSIAKPQIIHTHSKIKGYAPYRKPRVGADFQAELPPLPTPRPESELPVKKR